MSSATRTIVALAIAAFALCSSTTALARYKVTAGSVDKDKSLLTAGAEGAELTYQSGIVLRLVAHTRIRQHKDAKLWLDSSGQTPAHVFTLVEGRADVNVRNHDGPMRHAALVRAGTKLAGATSSGQMAALAGDKLGVVAALAGKVVASDGGRWEEVEPGSMVSLTSSSGAEMQAGKLPEAPKLLLKRRLWLALKGRAPVGDFSWAAAKGAKQYSLTISSKDGKKAFQRTLSALETGPELTQLEAGAYTVSVYAEDRYGLSGPASSATFNVVGVRNHRGSRVDADGVVHVGINQRAQFTHVDGLLMTYGSAKRWAPATETIPLYRHERTIVHFRHPNATDMVSARLEPRGVTADVYIGSKTAFWPGDPAHITVRIKDIKGATPEDLDVKFQVRLGIQPLSVEWNKQGNVFTATVPPQSGPGPWVLRVSVVDRFGIELGRDFLEISERPKKGHKKPGKKPAPSRASAGNELASTPSGSR